MATAVQIFETKSESALSVDEGRAQATSRSRQWWIGSLVPLAVLVAINVLCFSRSLSGYFLADDFIHISYLHKVVDGHPELLLQNFSGNWMQAQGTQFYRPFISLTLALDYLLGAASPVIFHLTNVLYQIASTVFLFLLTRRILTNFNFEQKTTAAFFAAALFAACPLHPEVVSWIIGRVDSVCTAFYLAAFWLFLKGKQDGSSAALTASFGCFAVSLLSKEMAVTLPPTLALFYFLNARQAGLMQRIKLSLKETWSLWALLLVYATVRTAALGTVSGGYSGSIGEGFNNSFIKRWFLDGSLQRIFLPFNGEVFGSGDKWRKLLPQIYLVGAILCLARFFRFNDHGYQRYILFAAGWFVLAMIPTYQVFNITETLQCSRFVYMGTAPLSLLAALLILPFMEKRDRLAVAFKWAAVGVLSTLVVVFALITYKNNLPWVHASAQAKAFRQAIETEVSQLPAGAKLVIFNVPQRLQGAHMIYNGAMLDVLLSAPLSKEPLFERVISFEPMTYGDSNLISVSRLRRLTEDVQLYKYFRWEGQQKKLVPVDLKAGLDTALPSWDMSGLQLPAKVGATLHLQSPLTAVAALGVDFIEITMAAKIEGTTKMPQAIFLSWATESDPFFTPQRLLSLPVKLDGKKATYIFPVSERKEWLSSGVITQLDLELPFMANQADPKLTIEKLALVSGAKQIPTIAPAPPFTREARDGACRGGSSSLWLFSFDATKIPAAESVVIEISAPDSWFEHYSGTLRDRELSSHHSKQIVLARTTGEISLTNADFAGPGYYEIRVGARDKQGRIIGYMSDAVNLQVSSAR